MVAILYYLEIKFQLREENWKETIGNDTVLASKMNYLHLVLQHNASEAGANKINHPVYSLPAIGQTRLLNVCALINIYLNCFNW